MAVVEWAQVKLLGDEYEARQRTRPNGIKKDREERFDEYQTAVCANRQLAVVLQSQGINEDAGRFIYRAQVLQRKAFWTQRSFGKWLFSLLLFLAAGYGYRPWRSFLTYFLVIFSFASCTKSALPCVKKRSR